MNMPLAKRLLSAFLISILIFLLIAFGTLDSLDQAFSDRFYQHAGAGSRDILVIGMDQASLDTLGPMPWPRNYMAEAVTFLNNADPDARPAVIGIDVLYSGENPDNPAADLQLAKAAAQYGNVVVASAAVFDTAFVEENGIFAAAPRTVTGWDSPFPALEQSADTGHINAMADSDGVFRHSLLYVDKPDGSRVFSFARVIYEKWCAFVGEEPSPLPKTSKNGFWYLPFSTAGGEYCDGISFLDLLDGEVDSSFYRDKIILIGPYASGMQDAYPTSLDRASLMHGIDIQANTVEAFQKAFYPHELSHGLQLSVLFLILFILAFLFWKQPLHKVAVIWACSCLGWVLLCFLLYRLGFILHILWVPVGISVLFLASVLLNYLRARNEKIRVAAELDVARKIQYTMLPAQHPPFPDHKEFSLYASMTPAKKVGGDFFDYFLIDENHLGLAIGDVAGKGVPASLFMTVSSVLLRDHALQLSSPAEVLRSVNNMICMRNEENMFVTVWFGILDLRTGELTAANAGHEYPILKDPDGQFHIFKDRHGMPIGAMEGVRYREYSLSLSPGTVLLVYTDGLPEATNTREEQFGLDRAIALLNKADTTDPDTIIHLLHDSVMAFTGSAPQFDDLTMLSLVWHGHEDAVSPVSDPEISSD